VADNKIIGEILIPIEPPGPARPAPKELVVEPESDADVEIAEGRATLSAPAAETGTYVVHVRPRPDEDDA
jgi:hypothetical protein